MNPFRVVLLGCGHAARIHAQTLRSFKGDVELYFASRRVGAAEEYRRIFHGAGSFSSYEEAIANPKMDGVLVLTPPAYHLTWVLKSLEHGKHVVVEKPPFLNLAEFDRAAVYAKQVGRRLLVAENYGYKPLLRVLRQWFDRGWLDDIHTLYINALKIQKTGDWRDDPAVSGGGALFEGGIHWIHFMNNLGWTVREAHAYFPGERTSDGKTATVVFEYKEGPVGTLVYSWETHAPLKGLRISRMYGTASSIVFESNGVFLCRYGRRFRITVPGLLKDAAGYRAMYCDYLRIIRGEGEPLLTLERARRDLEILERISKH